MVQALGVGGGAQPRAAAEKTSQSSQDHVDQSEDPKTICFDDLRYFVWKFGVAGVAHAHVSRKMETLDEEIDGFLRVHSVAACKLTLAHILPVIGFRHARGA